MAGDLSWQGKAVAEDPHGFRRQMTLVGPSGGTQADAVAHGKSRSGCCPGCGESHVDRRPLMAAALDKVGLYGYEDVPLARLSAGQKRRVGLGAVYLWKTVPSGF
jgi:heme exporter protein A